MTAISNQCMSILTYMQRQPGNGVCSGGLRYGNFLTSADTSAPAKEKLVPHHLVPRGTHPRRPAHGHDLRAYARDARQAALHRRAMAACAAHALPGVWE